MRSNTKIEVLRTATPLVSLSLSLCALVLSFGISFAAEELSAPTISVSPDIYYPLDEVLFIEGRAQPFSTVQVHFEMSGVKPFNFNTKSDANGEWAFAGKVPLDAGQWEIRARIVSSDGKTSSWSNPRVVKAIVTGFSIGGFTIKYAPTVAIIILILFASLALLMYSVFRVRMTQRLEQEREMHERTALFEKALRDKEQEVEKEREMHAKADMLEKELHAKEREIVRMEVEQKFADIKRGLLSELEHLEGKMEKDGKLSTEEEEHRSRLLHQLREAEEEIEKRLKSI